MLRGKQRDGGKCDKSRAECEVEHEVEREYSVWEGGGEGQNSDRVRNLFFARERDRLNAM